LEAAGAAKATGARGQYERRGSLREGERRRKERSGRFDGGGAGCRSPGGVGVVGELCGGGGAVLGEAGDEAASRACVERKEIR